MFIDDIAQKGEEEKSTKLGKKSSAGKSLKKIFRQDETLKKIENQPASVSILMNPVRLSIFLHLCQNPCDHTRSIARNMDVSLTVINWHLGQLFRNGYIESTNIKGKRIYWPAEMILPDDLPIVKILRNDWANKIIKAISDNGGDARQKELVEKIQVIQQNVNVWLVSMTSAGVLDKVGHRMSARYRISTKIPIKIAEYDDAAKCFSVNLLDLLKKDGLMPKKTKLRGSRFSVNVNLPMGNRRLSIECNPLAQLRRILNQDNKYLDK